MIAAPVARDAAAMSPTRPTSRRHSARKSRPQRAFGLMEASARRRTSRHRALDLGPGWHGMLSRRPVCSASNRGITDSYVGADDHRAGSSTHQPPAAVASGRAAGRSPGVRLGEGVEHGDDLTQRPAEPGELAGQNARFSRTEPCRSPTPTSPDPAWSAMPPSSRPTAARSTPPSSRCDALSVHHSTNGVGTLTPAGEGLVGPGETLHRLEPLQDGLSGARRRSFRAHHLAALVEGPLHPSTEPYVSEGVLGQRQVAPDVVKHPL